MTVVNHLRDGMPVVIYAYRHIYIYIYEENTSRALKSFDSLNLNFKICLNISSVFKFYFYNLFKSYHNVILNHAEIE